MFESFRRSRITVTSWGRSTRVRPVPYGWKPSALELTDAGALFRRLEGAGTPVEHQWKTSIGHCFDSVWECALECLMSRSDKLSYLKRAS